MKITIFLEKSFFFFSIALLLVSCSKEKMTTGEVVDETEKPLVNVLVKVENSAFETTTKTDGLYLVSAVRLSFRSDFSGCFS